MPLDPIDYEKVALQARNLKGEFKGNRVKASHVVGKAVEAFAKLAFKPSIGKLPTLPSLLSFRTEEESCGNKPTWNPAGPVGQASGWAACF